MMEEPEVNVDGRLFRNLSGTEYEKVMRELIINHFARTAWGKQLAVDNRKKYQGKSGQQHELDLSFELDFEGLRLLVAVECKCYKRKVGVDDILEFASRIEDIGVHKGIVITTTGYMEGAIKLASAKGISLLVACAAEPDEFDIVIGSDGGPKPIMLKTHFKCNDFRISREETGIALRFATIRDIYRRIECLGSSGVDDMNNFEVLFSSASAVKRGPRE
jgi:hypothetical protein